MDNSIKILLTIDLEGGILVRQDNIEFINSEKGYISHVSKIPKKCAQKIKINVDSYNYFKSNECPYFSKSFIWSKMTERQRIEEHLKVISHDLNSSTFSYKILND